MPNDPGIALIQMPVGSVILKRITEINQKLANHVKPTKSDGWVPQISVSPDQQKIYATKPTGALDLTCASPSEDHLLGDIRKQTAPVWSAYVKKSEAVTVAKRHASATGTTLLNGELVQVRGGSPTGVVHGRYRAGTEDEGDEDLVF